MTVLSTEHLSIAFGGVHALEDVSLAVAPGLVFSIIGPNGAGKTTLFNIISGLYLAQRGCVRLAGEDVSSLAPEELTSSTARTPPKAIDRCSVTRMVMRASPPTHSPRSARCRHAGRS